MNKDLLRETTMRGFLPEKIVRHFKGSLYQIIGIATHSETGKSFMVYRSLDSGKNYIRPLEMFLSKVDREKYPDATQEYRFEAACGE